MRPVIRIVKTIIKGIIALNLAAMASAFAAKQLVPAEGDERSDEFVHPTVMFGTEFKSEATALRYGKVFTFMGGASVDLTGAELAHGAELEIITIISSILAIRSGKRENFLKKEELWDYIHRTDERLYRGLRRGILGVLVNLPGVIGRNISQGFYRISQKIYGFN